MSAFTDKTVGSVKHSLGFDWGGDFDVVLSRKEVSTHIGVGVQSYMLTLKLRIRLEQVNPLWKYGLHGDADDTPFVVRTWDATNWATFLQGARMQADMWNRKFWLKPPNTVTDYDETNLDGTKRRPYLQCALDVDFTASAAAAHKTIQVVSLEERLLPATKDSSNFRSHAMLYDSLDTVPSLVGIEDVASQVNFMQRYTIAHELGHSLGLDHVGVLMKTPLCELAIALEKAGLAKGVHAGGSNSLNCYGWNHPQHIAENVMGFGAGFTAINAQPWQWGLRKLRSAPATEQWEVKLADPGGWFIPPPPVRPR